MQTDLWVILGEKDGAVAIAGSYKAEFDPTPGLVNIVGQYQQLDAPWDRYYAIRISEDRAVSLQAVEIAPRFSEMIGQIGKFHEQL